MKIIIISYLKNELKKINLSIHLFNVEANPRLRHARSPQSISQLCTPCSPLAQVCVPLVQHVQWIMCGKVCKHLFLPNYIFNPRHNIISIF